jgi:DNA-binding CsgD family transcriptional regulator
MKIKSVLLINLLVLSVSMFPNNLEVDSLLKVLDSEILNSHQYLERKIIHIDSLKRELKYISLNNDESQLKLISNIVDSYKSLNYDSAIVYVDRMNELALKSGDTNITQKVQMELCALLISGGLFSPALDNMMKINVDKLNKSQKEKYYYLFARLNYDLANFIADNNFSKQYRQKGDLYQDTLIQILDKRSIAYHIALAKLQINKTRNFNEAIRLLLSVYEKENSNQHDYAIITSMLAYLYSRVGDEESQKRMLIYASLSDIRNAEKETTAILQLAQILYREGDLERSHKYVQQALEDATIYNARHRKVQVSAILPLIETERMILEKEKRARMFIVIVVISALTIFVIVLLFVIYRQLKGILRSRDIIQNTNFQLETINGELKEANKIKDKYIIDFFDVCYEYIAKMDNQQSAIRKKLREKKYEELYKMLDVSIIEEERIQLFHTFDRIFISLFPTFIEDFNKLLNEESQYQPKKNEILNTELRIFSLIRLGIDDVVYISKFLNCSVNTIYTYRTKVKNKATIQNLKDFEQAILKIGLKSDL